MAHLYITHPEVVMDPAVPVPEWRLSDIGRARAEAFARRAIIPRGAPVFSSTERKAIELAEIIAAAAGSSVTQREDMGENDRSATGYLPQDRFEAQVERFFSNPKEGPGGWESALEAERRIVLAVDMAVLESRTDTVVFCGHGGVGTLLKCDLAGRAASRAEDQREMAAKGGGNCFVFALDPRHLLTDWVAMEDLAGLPA